MLRAILPVVLLMFSLTALGQQSTTVYFGFDKWELTTEAQQSLENLLRQKPFASLSIYGHTDQIGSEEYNRALSNRRADAVRNFLLNNGVDAGAIKIVQGYGEEQPAIDKLDPISRQANRRVTVEIIKDVSINKTVAPIPSVVDSQDSAPSSEIPKAKPAQPTAARQQTKQKLIEELKDSTIKAGDNIVLKNINFIGGRHAFLPTAYPSLQDLLETMQAVPTLEIEIQGHICCQPGGGDGLDLDTGEPFLSYNRAKAVFEFLVRRGIDRKRMRYRGFGRRFPIVENEITEEEKTTNRRVEIKIIKK